MPVPELVFELIAPIGRFLVWLFVEVLWELLVKGAGWTPERIVGREVVRARGGRVVCLPGFGDLSTSRLVDRVRRPVADRPTR